MVFELADDSVRVACRRLVVADGARSPLGRVLGREWHRDTAYGVAARGYVALRAQRRRVDQLAPGAARRRGRAALRVRLGLPARRGGRRGEHRRRHAGHRPAPGRGALRALLEIYTDARREEWGLDGPVRAPASALLPMGGAVSGVAGRNWALIGDAAGCVNPLNGEGIDYGLETGRSVAELLGERRLVHRLAGRPCGGTTARRSPSPGGWPGCSPCRGSCPPPGRSACGRGR